MIAPKQDFIVENVLPVLKPLFVFFAQFGVGSTAVIGIPAIILVALTVNRKRIDSLDSILKISVIGIILLAIIVQQSTASS